MWSAEKTNWKETKMNFDSDGAEWIITHFLIWDVIKKKKNKDN